MGAICIAEAKKVAAECGGGYETSLYTGKNRVNASVATASASAYRNNSQNNTLIKGLMK